MTYQEMERSMEFILQQQARSEAWLLRFEASVQRSIDSILDQEAKNSSDIIQLKTLGVKLAQSQLRTDKRLAASHERLEKLIKDSHRELAEVQKKTDLRFNAFIAALERQFGRNGRGRKPA